MKVLITGTPGWLGTRFIELLSKKEKHIKCLVKRGIDTSPIKKYKASIHRGDITEKYTLPSIVKDTDTIFHLAGVIHAKPSVLYNVNYIGTKNLLECAVEEGVNRFIYISSNSAVGYQLDRDKLLTELTSRRPYMAYGYSKYLAEETVRNYGEEGLLDTIILRPCWYYGPNQPKRQTKLFKMIKKGKPIIFGDGSNLRSMSYIDNVVQALLLAGKSKLNNRTYWIADNRPYTVNEIYETIAELLDVKKYKPRHIPSIVSKGLRTVDTILQKFNIYSSYIHVGGEMTLDIGCSIDKAKKELGYNPKVSLRKGMEESIKWCKINHLL